MKTVFAAALVVVLSGCASMQQLEGLQIDPRDYAECAETQDCTVWSGRQLQYMAEQFFNKGRQVGAADSL